MSTPKANQSTNELEVLVGSHTVLSTNAAEFESLPRILNVYGQHSDSGFINVRVSFFPPDTPAQLKKGDVLRVVDIDGVHLNFTYRFEGDSHVSDANEGHLTVEDIDLSVPLFKARFEFRGPHQGGVGHFHGRFSVIG